MSMHDIRRCDVRGKRVVVRVDLNAEVDSKGRVRDLTRLRSIVPTVTWLRKHGASVVLVAHRGRPQGVDPKLSLRPYVVPLGKILGEKIGFQTDTVTFAREIRSRLRNKGQKVTLVENVRFLPGEERNLASTAKLLASLGDVYVLDAFASAHRAHASISGVGKYTKVWAGILLQNEVSALTQIMKKPARPFVALIGGAKISTKLGVVRRFMKIADYVLLGGALANTVLQAEGVAIGASLTEPEMVRVAKGLRSSDAKLELPVDVVVRSGKKIRTVAIGRVGINERIMDIGPDTVDVFSRALQSAKTIIWNGPMGVYEEPAFAKGTVALARRIKQTRPKCSVAGGGETLDAIHRAHVESSFTFLSTGGGAMLEFLEGKTLPGLAVVTQ